LLQSKVDRFKYMSITRGPSKHLMMAEDSSKELVETKEEDRALIEFYSSFKDLFEFFCLNTTIHGTVRLVCSSRNRMKTAFWTLLFLASFAMLYWQFALLFNQYWAYPVVMKLSVHSEPKMFPAVTLCNLNPHRIKEVSKNLAELDNLTKKTLHDLYVGLRLVSSADVLMFCLHLRSLARRCSNRLHVQFFFLPQCNATGGDCYYKWYLNGVDAVQEWYRFHYMNIMSQIPPIIDVSHDEDHIRDLVYACQYGGDLCQDSDMKHFHHPVYGSCYTYNKNGTNTFWEARKPGILYGLSLILKVEQKDHIPLLSTEAGVRVMIHSHDQMPFLEHEGFDIRPGIETTIGIKQDLNPSTPTSFALYSPFSFPNLHSFVPQQSGTFRLDEGLC
uniref:Uncharacterized protein n=1 Tax=Salvator merianae TaxID=96440 RepID=A0A8D0BQ24_SALMN